MAARAPVTKTAANGPNPTAGVAITWTAATAAADYNYIALTRRTMILFWNSGATPHTWGLQSGPDERGRTSLIAGDTLAAGVIDQIVVEPMGWVQSGTNQLFVQADHAEVMIAAIEI